jgi:hypothetical protein
MSLFRRLGLAFVFAVTLAGGVLISSPTQAALPGPVCSRLAAAIDVLKDLAEKYPDNPIIAMLLARAQAAYESSC